MGKKKKQEKAKSKSEKVKKKQKVSESEKLLKPEKKKNAKAESGKAESGKAESGKAENGKAEIRRAENGKPEKKNNALTEENHQLAVSATRVKNKKPAPDVDIVRAAEQLKAVGDISRIQILKLLAQKEYCAGELLEQMPIVQSTLSHHMKVLVDSGIVRCRKQGKWSYYSLDRDMLSLISESIIKLVDE